MTTTTTEKKNRRKIADIERAGIDGAKLWLRVGQEQGPRMALTCLTTAALRVQEVKLEATK